MSKENTKEFLASLDPKLIEEAIKLQKVIFFLNTGKSKHFQILQAATDSTPSGSTLIPSPPIDETYEYFAASRRSSYAGSRKGSTYEASKTTNIQPQMNMALSVAENFIGKSPSLRRVSVNHDEAPKAGFFGKKKAQEPSLVFTFTADDFVNDIKDLDRNETKSSVFDSVVSE